MKYFDWDALKSIKLKAERGVCFEDVLTAIDENGILDNLVHPNQSRYPGQYVLIVEIVGYVYLVPYIEDNIKIFLKTIIPSRKATKKYLKGESQ